MPAPRIVCVLCPSFHGATLLSLVLANHRGVLSLGDTVATEPNHHCGCGVLVSNCAFWTQVGPISARPQLLASPQLNQAATILGAIAAHKLGAKVRFGSFAADVEHEFAVCRQFAEFDIFIDGFKSVSRYCALKAAGFPVRGVIHLLRDPRSFAASSKRKQVPVTTAAAQWSQAHRTISLATRAMGERVFDLRYEDLCASPEQQLARLQAWLGLEPESLLHPFAPGRHWVGNRTMRAFDGTIALRETWRGVLRASEQAAVMNACRKEARRWGYDLSAG
jgi:hypothetical protein